uniref:Uncharacterized protein n=1 Tax=viral metagenome TaxID=1070528 RepID=A0A6C0KGW1_9ZZZZ
MFPLKKVFANKKIIIALVVLAVLVLGYFYFSRMIKTKEHISSNNLDALLAIIDATGVSDDNKIQAIKLLNISDPRYADIINSTDGNKMNKIKRLLNITA